MTKYYQNQDKFYVGIDCIIFGFDKGELKVLLLHRNFEPAKGDWSLSGGFVREDESIDEAAQRVLFELTGLRNNYMQQVGAFGKIDRDPGARVISLVYYALINVSDYDKNLVKMHHAHWVNIDKLPPLIFDHNQMVEKARELMKKQISYQPISFNLLPELFTLTQLQTLYEAINGEVIDKRNFRKKVATMDFIEKTDLIDKTSSRRGARLYRFNKSTYKKDPRFHL